MTDNIADVAQQIARAYADKDRSLEIVQDLVMHSQPEGQNWHFVSTQTYELPGKWIWIVLLWREVGVVSDGRLEVRMKAEMVAGQEGEDGKMEYRLKSREK